MLRPGLIRRDERQIDVGFEHGGKLDLRLLRRFLETLKRHPVLAQIDAITLAELRHDPVDDPLVEVVAAKVRVAVGRLHLDDALSDFEDRNVEGAAAEVVDGNRLVLLLVEAVGQRRRGGLVDDTQHVEAGDFAGVFGRLALRIVEVRRNGDHRIGDLLSEIVLGGRLQLLKNQRGDFRRRVFLAADLDPRIAVVGLHDPIGDARGLLRDLAMLAPHEALDREDRVVGIGDGLALRNLTDQPLPVLGESHHRRRRPAAFLVDHNSGLSAFHDRDHRVGGAEVDSNHFAHLSQLPRKMIAKY